MKRIQRHILVTAVVLCVSIAAAADVRSDGTPPGGTFGVSAAVQSNQYELLLPYWLDAQSTIIPVVRIIHVEDGGDDVGLGLILRYHLRAEKAAPFIGLRAKALIDWPRRGDAVTDVLVGGLAGGEYFFDRHFSIAVEAQLNVTISSEDSFRFGNPGGVDLNTATGLFAAFYF